MGWTIHISFQFTIAMINMVLSVREKEGFIDVSQNTRVVMEDTNAFYYIKIENFKIYNKQN